MPTATTVDAATSNKKQPSREASLEGFLKISSSYAGTTIFLHLEQKKFLKLDNPFASIVKSAVSICDSMT